MCDEFPEILAEPGLPPPRAIEHEVHLKDPKATIPRARPYRMSPFELDECKRQVEALLEKGWICESSSQYSHPMLFVKKKDGTMRVVIDYCLLNANTVVDRYPLPRIDALLDKLGGARCFSAIDLRSGYHQMAMAEGHQNFTAFFTPIGLYEYTVLPMGLINAPRSF